MNARRAFAIRYYGRGGAPKAFDIPGRVDVPWRPIEIDYARRPLKAGLASDKPNDWFRITEQFAIELTSDRIRWIYNLKHSGE
jgi:hypothetical protein